MREVFPVVAGAVVGLASHRLIPARLRLAALIALSVLFGVLASALAGELAIGPEFILVDIPQVFIVAVLTLALARAWGRRSFRIR